MAYFTKKNQHSKGIKINQRAVASYPGSQGKGIKKEHGFHCNRMSIWVLGTTYTWVLMFFSPYTSTYARVYYSATLLHDIGMQHMVCNGLYIDGPLSLSLLRAANTCLQGAHLVILLTWESVTINSPCLYQHRLLNYSVPLSLCHWSNHQTCNNPKIVLYTYFINHCDSVCHLWWYIIVLWVDDRG